LHRLFEFLFDLVLLLGSAACGWAAPFPRRLLLAVTVASATLLALAATAALWLYPLSDLLVLLFALAGGTWFGRTVPARALPFALVLATLALLDIGLNGLPAPQPGNPAQPLAAPLLYGNLVLLLPGGQRFLLGALDSALAATLGAQAHRRGRPLLAALLPPVLGLVLAFGVAARRPGGLPLLPFFLAGWLATEAGYRCSTRRPR